MLLLLRKTKISTPFSRNDIEMKSLIDRKFSYQIYETRVSIIEGTEH